MDFCSLNHPLNYRKNLFGPAGFVVGLVRFPSVLLVEWVPCFTALRVRLSTECWHAYASVNVLGKSREHVFFEWLFRIDLFLIA